MLNEPDQNTIIAYWIISSFLSFGKTLNMLPLGSHTLFKGGQALIFELHCF